MFHYGFSYLLCKIGSKVAVVLSPEWLKLFFFFFFFTKNFWTKSPVMDWFSLPVGVQPVSGAVTPGFGSVETDQLSCVTLRISSL